MNTIRVLLADDHELVRAGFSALLRELRIEVVAEASNGNEALSLIELHQPAVVLMDISMPGLNGLETTARALSQWPTVRIIILSIFGNGEYVREALRAGAAGYLLKNSSTVELELAIKAALRGQIYLSPAVAKFIAQDYISPRSNQTASLQHLSPRQLEIMQLLARGYSRKEISEKLNISVRTFDTYRTQLIEQLEIPKGAGLVRYAIQLGLITPEE
jgi:DNA-binding NarL/FixJ family response regulator